MAVNEALPSVAYLRDCYCVQEGGYAPKMGKLERVVARAAEDGSVRVDFYTFGQAKEKKDYFLEGNCAYVTDIVQDWIDGKTTKEEVGYCIKDSLND